MEYSCKDCKHLQSVQGYFNACVAPSQLLKLKAFYYTTPYPKTCKAKDKTLDKPVKE